jgi:hypothetical protein
MELKNGLLFPIFLKKKFIILKEMVNSAGKGTSNYLLINLQMAQSFRSYGKEESME